MLNQSDITQEDYKIAESNGIKKRTLRARINTLGWDKQKAITTPVLEKKKRQHWVKVAEQNGINYQTFLSRVISLGWSEEKAASTIARPRKLLPKKNCEFALYKGDTFITMGTIEEIAKERGVKPQTISYYRYPHAQKRNPTKNGKQNRLILIPLDDEEDE